MMLAHMPRSSHHLRRFVFVVALVLTACGAPPAAQLPPTAQPAPVTALSTAAPLPSAVPQPSATVPQPSATVMPSATALPPTAPLPSATVPPSATPTLPPSATSLPSATPTVPPTTVPSPTLPPTAIALPSIAPALAAALQRVLDRTVVDGFTPGASVAVQVQGYAPWLGASGFVDMERTAPMTTSTRVRIASVSKIFTAVVVLQLVEAGKLNLDATLATYLPALVPQADQITLRQLLNHTSGLYDYLEDRAYFTPAYKLPDRIWQPSELVAHAAKYPLAFAPGAAGSWDYSSTNYVILGMVVEAVTGRTLAVEMRQRILDPLGLTETYFVPDEAVLGTQARGYKEAEDRTNINLSFAFATANLVATPRDMQRFAAGLFTSTLLRPESQAAMQTWVNGKGSYNMPELEYGLGLMRNRLPVAPAPDNGPRPEGLSTVLGHIGGFGGFRSALWYAPDGGTTIALAINQSDNDPNVLATALLEVVLSSQGR